MDRPSRSVCHTEVCTYLQPQPMEYRSPEGMGPPLPSPSYLERPRSALDAPHYQEGGYLQAARPTGPHLLHRHSYTALTGYTGEPTTPQDESDDSFIETPGYDHSPFSPVTSLPFEKQRGYSLPHGGALHMEHLGYPNLPPVPSSIPYLAPHPEHPVDMGYLQHHRGSLPNALSPMQQNQQQFLNDIQEQMSNYTLSGWQSNNATPRPPHVSGMGGPAQDGMSPGLALSNMLPDVQLHQVNGHATVFRRASNMSITSPNGSPVSLAPPTTSPRSDPQPIDLRRDEWGYAPAA